LLALHGTRVAATLERQRKVGNGAGVIASVVAKIASLREKQAARIRSVPTIRKSKRALLVSSLDQRIDQTRNGVSASGRNRLASSASRMALPVSFSRKAR
jgi:hypothetical protein